MHRVGIVFRFVFGYWADGRHDEIARWKQEREKEKIRNRFELVMKPNIVMYVDKFLGLMSIFNWYGDISGISLQR